MAALMIGLEVATMVASKVEMTVATRVDQMEALIVGKVAIQKFAMSVEKMGVQG